MAAMAFSLMGAVALCPTSSWAVEAIPGVPAQVMEAIQAQTGGGSIAPGGAIAPQGGSIAPGGAIAPQGGSIAPGGVMAPQGAATSVPLGSAPAADGAKSGASPSPAPQADGNQPQAPDQNGAQLPDQVLKPGAADTTVGSLIEGQYRSFYGSSLGQHLMQFGYKIFDNAQIKIDHLALPGDDYRIGPGDKLRIRVWGSGVDSEFVGVVERNGTINVPQIGIVDIADVSYGQVEQVIRKESEKYIQGVNINVSLVDLRSVQVYVVGSVARPSLHMVPAFSTVFDGLVSAGGVSKAGSLRTIELYRQGKLLKRFDLYDLLLHGKRDADLVLENRDVIYVPRLGETVAISGAVGEAAIFELNGEKSVADCLALAGGLLPQGYAGRLHLRRYQGNREFVIQDINTERDPKALTRTTIQNGDLIEWVFLSEKMAQVVNLQGHVWSPDFYQYRPGMTLAEVLPSNRILKPEAVTDFAILHRYDTNTTRFTTQKIPLPDVFAGKFNMELKPYDRITIYSRQELGIKEEFTINGAVWNPGVKPFSYGLTLSGALALAGGERLGAVLSGIEVSRQVIKDGEAVTTIMSLDVKKDAGFPLQPADYILVKQVKDVNTIKTVHIRGEVRFPGDYKLNEGERLSQLIERAGGFLPSAYFYGAKFTSQRALEIQQKSINDLISGMEMQLQQSSAIGAQTALNSTDAQAEAAAQEATKKALATLKGIKAEGRVAIQLADLSTFAGSSYDFVLEGEDSLVVPQQHNFVSVVGSVYAPNSFHYEPNRTVDYYLTKSGGVTKDADSDSVYILKVNGETLSKGQSSLFSFSRFSSQVLMPGDTIVVPVDFDRVPYLRLMKDVSDIIFKIATTAGVAIAALQ
jgi:protein involved in polysaccharide export with SLBB domain